MSYETLFNSWRSDGEVRISTFIQKPEKLDTTESIAYYDSKAARVISECQGMMQKMSDYRMALAARYAELETMPYKRLLKLERHPHYKGIITYTVHILKIFEDGTTNNELLECYSGKERHKAFKRFETLKKQFPGIKTEKDVERKSWE